MLTWTINTPNTELAEKQLSHTNNCYTTYVKQTSQQTAFLEQRTVILLSECYTAKCQNWCPVNKAY